MLNTYLNNSRISRISDHIYKGNLLQTMHHMLIKDFSLTLCIGVEIEFYLPYEHFSNEFIKERGVNQYEVHIACDTNLESIINQIALTMDNLCIAHPNINFHPKPFINDYGNAMHFHINLLDATGANYFDNATHIEHAANSLCHYMMQTFAIFAPHDSHYSRYVTGFMAPTHVSHGCNNRTVAIRIPDAIPKRLEHRLASPMTDPYLALFVIVKSIYYGLKYPDQVKKYSKIYGNASDSHYCAEALPKSMNDALRILSEDFLIKV